MDAVDTILLADKLNAIPKVLGSGRPLFARQEAPLGLRLSGARSFDRGAVRVTYTPEAA
jgi:hypothetical protein